MTPSVSPGRRIRAPKFSLRSAIAFTLLAAVACNSGAPTPTVENTGGKKERTGTTTGPAPTVGDRKVGKEGGTGTRAKADEGLALMPEKAPARKDSPKPTGAPAAVAPAPAQAFGTLGQIG